jgi:uncharacterized protein YukE
MADLSPQARAVLNAADSVFDEAGTTNQGIAAALRVAADQVEQKWQGFAHEACQEIRAIADELDNNSTHK